MKVLLNSSEMKSCDVSTMMQYGIPSEVLMERAALAVRDAAVKHFHPENVLVLCGSGNNGGDGFAAARLLMDLGIRADVLFLGTHARMTKQCQLEEDIFQRCGGQVLPDDASLSGYDLIIDALFGIGLSREVLGRYADLINAVNRSDTPVLSVDMPSGVSADSGQILGTAIHADLTVTFQFEKLGQKLFPGAERCGKLITCDVGIRNSVPFHAGFQAASGCSNPDKGNAPAYTLEENDLPALLPRRHADDHKGDCGKLLIISGNTGMAGAAILAARSALRSGVGMVCVLSHPDNRLAVQTAVPEALFAPWPADLSPDSDGRKLLARWLLWCDAAAVGPGLGTDASSLSILTAFLRNYRGSAVLDADALNLLAEHQKLLSPERLSDSVSDTAPGTDFCDVSAVITPHPGEMSRLTHSPVNEILTDPVHVARSYSRKTGMTVVLKGARTVVTDGADTMLNTLGNEGMATAGSGDSLTGIIGSLLAQGLEPFDAAQAGVLLHAMAGDKAAEALGTRSMKAGDLADFLPEVLKGIRF